MEEVSPPDNKTKGYRYRKIANYDHAYIDTDGKVWNWTSDGWSKVPRLTMDGESWVWIRKRKEPIPWKVTDLIDQVFGTEEQAKLDIRKAAKLKADAKAMEVASEFLETNWIIGEVSFRSIKRVANLLRTQAKEKRNLATQLSKKCSRLSLRTGT